MNNLVKTKGGGYLGQEYSKAELLQGHNQVSYDLYMRKIWKPVPLNYVLLERIPQ